MNAQRAWWMLGFLFFVACRDEQAGPKKRAPKDGVSSPSARSQDQGPAILDALPSPLNFESGVTLAQGSIVYLGSSWKPQRPRPGETVTFAHYFKAAKPPQPTGFDLFVHLVDPTSLQMLGNADHAFANGRLPIGAWPEGKILRDVHTLPFPVSASGKVQLLLGFWKGDERMSVDLSPAHDGQNRLLGPTVDATMEVLPEYRVRKTNKPPVIDGVIEADEWKNATVVSLVSSFDGSQPPLKTTARLLYDDTHLYAAFDSEDPDVYGTLMKRDDPIYNEEVVELFIDANADGRTYNELQVSPNNVNFDAYFPARRQGMDLSFDSQMTTAVSVQGTLNNPEDKDQGWQAEMKVPIARLHSVPNVPPKPGDRWRFNLYRLELFQRKQQQGQAFSPLGVGDFHHLPRFGWLVFEPPQ